MEEILGGTIRVVGRFLFEVVFGLIIDLLFHIPGYYICKPFSGNGQEPKPGWVFLFSIIFWVVVGLLAYGAYSLLGAEPNA
ncbi:hypothetical protein ACJJIX_03655 [Microbulbifer sp. VAAC004]|uniref:hypothetical protein n=1 Tax=unclassified Microbulbifer TaxID=2619833 RepID=UPI00403A63D1